MIAIIDYGMGNLRSVQKAFEKVGAEALITQNVNEIKKADKIVLPGVGAIKPAVEKLNSLELIPIIKSAISENKPFLGICLGFQILFDKSDEGGDVSGLGVLAGQVKKFTSLKVPHMGWNQITIQQANNPLLRNINSGENFYFCHSFYVKPNDTDIIATTTNYEIDFTSSIAKNNLFGVQFHPEKSQTIGLKIVENFVKI